MCGYQARRRCEVLVAWHGLGYRVVIRSPHLTWPTGDIARLDGWLSDHFGLQERTSSITGLWAATVEFRSGSR